MLEVFGDLWTYVPPGERVRASPSPSPIVRCITTNGMVKRDGTCVMGRGCAREAAKKWPGLPRIIGARIKESGNDVFLWTEYLSGKEPTVVNQLLIFPVKHKWMEPADPNLISMSAASLAVFAAQRPSTIFLLPRPGCGNGQLDWKDVKPLLEFLPDNVLVITNEEQADG